jgi:hypothetical protein
VPQHRRGIGRETPNVTKVLPGTSNGSESKTGHDIIGSVENLRMDAERPSGISAPAVNALPRKKIVIDDTRQLRDNERNGSRTGSRMPLDFVGFREPERPYAEKRRQRAEIDLSVRPRDDDEVKPLLGAGDEGRSRLRDIDPEKRRAFLRRAERPRIRKEGVRQSGRIEKRPKRAERRGDVLPSDGTR